MMNKFLSKIIIFLIISMLIFIFPGCAREEYDNVPYVPVNYRIDIINHLNIGINESAVIRWNDEYTSRIIYPNSNRPETIINSKTYGNGIIIFKSADGFVAYDRTCTYKAREDYCGVDPHENISYKYICPCCSSVYDLVLDGYPVDTSKATRPLIQHGTTVYGNELVISN